MSKIRLYIDVDDVIIAQVYKGSGFDLRPGVMTQLRVLSRLFDCRWLTCWSKKPLYELMRHLYGARLNQDMSYANWGHGHPWRKAGYVLDDNQPEDFWWLEDPLCDEEIAALEKHGKLDRFISVEPHGQWAFLDSIKELFRRCGTTDTDIKRVGGKPEWFQKEAILVDTSSKEIHRMALNYFKFLLDSSISSEDKLKEIQRFVDIEIKTSHGGGVGGGGG